MVAEPTDWPSTERPRRAGVSSFGFGGTNAHVVLEQGPDPDPVVGGTASPAVTTLVVSGKTAERVASTAGVLADWMDGDGAEVGLADVAHTLNHHRARHGKFATVCARDRAQAVAGLRALAAGQPAPGVVGPHEGSCAAGHGVCVFRVRVRSGRGWAGSCWPMSRRSPRRWPSWSRCLLSRWGFRCGRCWPAVSRWRGSTRIQPVLVGVQLALTELWRSYGVHPDAVIGHSMGEVSAAVVAGALSAGRGVAGDRHPVAADGAAGRAGRDGAAGAGRRGRRGVDRRLPRGERGGVCLAAPDGDRRAARAGRCGDRGGGRPGPVGAAHRGGRGLASPDHRSDPARVACGAGRFDARERRRFRSSSPPCDRHRWAAHRFDAEYWVANLRNPVRFSQAVAAAGAEHGTFVEVSPHPLLTHAISDTLGGVHHHSIGTLQRDTHDTLTFHTNLNTTHTVHPPDTEHPPEPHPLLPTTPWHHSQHWISGTSAAPVAAHPLLGIGVTDPTNGTRVWESTLGPDFLWLGDHCVDDACVLPGAAYAELALAAVTEAFGTDSDKPWMIA